MKRRFTLPAAFAMALLGELLLGVSPKAAPGRGIPPSKAGDEAGVFELPPEPPEPVDAAGGPALDHRSVPRPEQEELPSPSRPGDFIQWERPSRPTVSGVVLTIDPVWESTPGTPGRDGPGGPSFIESGMLDDPPRARVQPPPAYPPAARMAGLNGEVVVEFIVTAEGRVAGPRVVRSSDPAFEEPTLRAVSKWRFESGKVRGRTVPFHMIAPVVFRVGG